MKVFLSWSGTRSHRVALVFRDWLPSVIQEIVPYVSSEDIDKGARWSTDIAKELSDSTFGILCVTRDNIYAPWLTFEAGALSKTMDKAFVSPFLFDTKRSEVDGPILQFQSTIFEKEDLKKLVITLNKTCEKNCLAPDRLEKAFEVWYPTLESELNKLHEPPSEGPKENDAAELQTPRTQEILEEILDLSRINQKLLRNPDGALAANLEQMNGLLQELLGRIERAEDPTSIRQVRKFNSMIIDELLHMSPITSGRHTGIQMVLALIRNQYPWLYDAGIETLNIIRSRRTDEEKHQAVKQFSLIVEITFEHPMMREAFGVSKEFRFLARELPHLLMRGLEATTS